MRRAAALIFLVYLLMLVVLAGPVIWLCFSFPGTPPDLGDLRELFRHWLFWLWLGVMLLGEAALLFVPLRLARQRPVSRRSLWVPILASGLLAGGLGLGAVAAVDEFIRAGFKENLWWANLPALALIHAVWVLWAAVFWFYARRRSPREVAGRLQLWLFRSSLLTLLVAVPTHVVARQRDYCCAGFGTFIGIAFGLPVLLLSFGPGIFWLYARRWKQIHPEDSDPPPADEAPPPTPPPPTPPGA